MITYFLSQCQVESDRHFSLLAASTCPIQLSWLSMILSFKMAMFCSRLEFRFSPQNGDKRMRDKIKNLLRVIFYAVFILSFHSTYIYFFRFSIFVSSNRLYYSIGIGTTIVIGHFLFFVYDWSFVFCIIFCQ